MTVTTDERGQKNLFAKEPKMYVSDEDAQRYAIQTHNEKAEICNAYAAMLGFVAGLASYVITGKLFFGMF
jgi:hypothetical protein